MNMHHPNPKCELIVLVQPGLKCDIKPQEKEYSGRQSEAARPVKEQHVKRCNGIVLDGTPRPQAFLHRHRGKTQQVSLCSGPRTRKNCFSARCCKIYIPTIGEIETYEGKLVTNPKSATVIYPGLAFSLQVKLLGSYIGIIERMESLRGKSSLETQRKHAYYCAPSQSNGNYHPSLTTIRIVRGEKERVLECFRVCMCCSDVETKGGGGKKRYETKPSRRTSNPPPEGNIAQHTHRMQRLSLRKITEQKGEVL